MASTINAKNTSTGVVITPDASGQLELQTADTTRMTIDVNGNVGIGTSSPATKLQVTTGATGTQALFSHSSGTPTIAIGNSTTNYNLQIGYNVSSEYGYIQATAATGVLDDIAINPSGGNVGIGTSSPSYKLDVAGQIASQDAYLITANSSGTPSAGAFIFRPASNTIALGTASTERMRIDSSGNVGIGTSSPSVKFQVNGEIRSTNGTEEVIVSGSNGSIEIVRTAGNPFIDFKSAIAEDFDCRIQQDNNGLAFSTGGNGAAPERMRIDSNGRVQINDTAVVSGLTARLTITSATSTESNITLKDSGTTYGTGTQYISFANSSNASAGSIQHTAVTTVAYATTSDARLKENIKDALSSLDKIAQAKVRSFDWKEDKKHVDYGFIAQELYEVYPDAVCKGDDSVEIENPKETWQVDYGRITPLLLKAIQELKAELDTVKAELATLKGTA